MLTLEKSSPSEVPSDLRDRLRTNRKRRVTYIRQGFKNPWQTTEDEAIVVIMFTVILRSFSLFFHFNKKTAKVHVKDKTWETK